MVKEGGGGKKREEEGRKEKGREGKGKVRKRSTSKGLEWDALSEAHFKFFLELTFHPPPIKLPASRQEASHHEKVKK
jgi:hypothetical protein